MLQEKNGNTSMSGELMENVRGTGPAELTVKQPHFIQQILEGCKCIIATYCGPLPVQAAPATKLICESTSSSLTRTPPHSRGF